MPFIICGSVMGCLWAHATELRRSGCPAPVGAKHTRDRLPARRRPTF